MGALASNIAVVSQYQRQDAVHACICSNLPKYLLCTTCAAKFSRSLVIK